MSWSMWHVCGIGFDLGSVEPKKYVDFLKAHKDAFEASRVCNYISKESRTEIYENPEKPAYEDGGDYLDDIRGSSDSGTLAEAVADIMTKETGIGFDYPGITDEGEDCVLFCACYPWGYNGKEKALTRESLIALMGKYADELGVKVHEDVDLVYAG